MAFIRSNILLLCLLSNCVHFALPATLYPSTTMSNRANRNRHNASSHLDPVKDLYSLIDVENRPPVYPKPTKSATTEEAKTTLSAVSGLQTTLTPSNPPQNLSDGIGTKATVQTEIMTESGTTGPTQGSSTEMAPGPTTRPVDNTTEISSSSSSSAMTINIVTGTLGTTSTAAPSVPPEEPLGFIPSPPCHLNATSISPLKIIVTWQRPINVSLRFIKGYTMYYYRSKFKDKGQLPKPIQLFNTATYRDIKTLNPGTNFSIYLLVNFTNNVSLRSNTVWVITEGYGPDRACVCDPMGAINTSICDAITGQCPCQGLYAGKRCDTCRPGYYRFPKSPCAPCPCNRTVSTGVCSADHNQVQCMCRGDNIGPRCEICKNGYFVERNSALCKLCVCHGNAKLNSPHICDENTGKCFECQYNTTGDHCDRCLPGFIGDPIAAKNCTKFEVDNTVPTTPVDIYKKLTHRGHVVIGVSVTFGMIFFVIIGVLGCKRYLNWRRWQPQPFWTVELKDDHETVSFSSMVDQEYQNVDAALLMDDVGYYDRSMQGQLRVKSPENTPSYHSINA